MIVLDSSVVWQIVLFLLLWLIISKVLFRPYMVLLEEREQKTTGAYDNSYHLEHEAERLRAQYEQAIADAVAAVQASKDAVVQEARHHREAILSEAREEAARIL